MTKSNVRTEVEELEKLGPLPSEDEAEVAQLERIEELYRTIAKPITDDEARVLVELFGPDGCYGVASSFYASDRNCTWLAAQRLPRAAEQRMQD
jgi:hypothetical protein